MRFHSCRPIPFITILLGTGMAIASISPPAGGQPARRAGQQRAPLPLRFNLDGSHSSIGFAVRFMGLSTVRGAFAGVAGTVMYAEGDPGSSSVSVVIDAASINTNSRARDNHLRSPDFFDVAKYPTITFRSTGIRATSSGFIARGPLTMHGVIREIEIPFTQLDRPQRDAWGNLRVTFEGGLELSRKEYGIVGTAFWNDEFDPGRMAVADKVNVELLVSANIPNPGRWVQPFGDSLLRSIEADGVPRSIARLRAASASDRRLDSVPEFAYLVAGEKLAASGRAADAIALYEAVVELRPSAMVVRQQLGEWYLKQGDWVKARDAFTRVLQSSPDATTSSEWIRVMDRVERSGSELGATRSGDARSEPAGASVAVRPGPPSQQRISRRAARQPGPASPPAEPGSRSRRARRWSGRAAPART